MKKIIYILIFSALVFASCQSEDYNNAADDSNFVKVSANIGSELDKTQWGITRTNPETPDAGIATKFNNNDAISVKVDDTQGAMPYTYYADGRGWVANQSRFLIWNQDVISYESFYPTTQGTTFNDFTLPIDQSSASKISNADYMKANGTAYKETNGGYIDIEFKRELARVIVKIGSIENQFDNTFKVASVKINSVSNGISNGIVVGDVTNIESLKNGDGGVASTFTALVIPAEQLSGNTFLTVTVSNGTQSVDLTVLGIPKHEKAKSYTYTLMVGKSKVEIDTDVLVEDWTTGTDYTETPIAAAPKVGNYYYVSDNGFGYSNKYDPNTTILGVVYNVVPNISEQGGSAYVVSMYEKRDVQWSLNTNSIDGTGDTNGKANMATVQRVDAPETNFPYYPAFAWVDSLNNIPRYLIPNLDYSTAINNIWYLPVLSELETLEGDDRNKVLEAIGKVPTDDNENITTLQGAYWTSTEHPVERDEAVYCTIGVFSGDGKISKIATPGYNAVSIMKFIY